MMIQHNISLKPYNSFGIDVAARYFARFNSLEDLKALLLEKNNKEPLLILGGGSNMLFTKDFDGWVFKNEMKGISVFHQDDDYVWVDACAGENWHAFVLDCITNNRAGVENLSLIPGNVGASPMQNIGAYGVEIKDVFVSLEAFSIQDKTLVTFSKEDCKFGYRESVFKRELKNKFVVTKVRFRLNKKPVYHTSYGAIQQELEDMGVQELSIGAISKAVIRIRQSKLPDPAVTGNAGSFFKNPEIETTQYLGLKHFYPDLPGYPTTLGNSKIPAGYLIEKAGWKGYRKGDTGVHPKQALVLVNYGNATGEEIFALSQKVLESVQEKFGISLEREVNIC